MKKLTEWIASNQMTELDESFEWSSLRRLVELIESRMDSSDEMDESKELIELIKLSELIEIIDLIKSLYLTKKNKAAELRAIIDSMDETERAELKAFMGIAQNIILENL